MRDKIQSIIDRLANCDSEWPVSLREELVEAMAQPDDDSGLRAAVEALVKRYNDRLDSDNEHRRFSIVQTAEILIDLGVILNANPPAPSQPDPLSHGVLTKREAERECEIEPDPLAMLEEMGASIMKLTCGWHCEVWNGEQWNISRGPTSADAIRAAYAEWVKAKVENKSETNDTKGKA